MTSAIFLKVSRETATLSFLLPTFDEVRFRNGDVEVFTDTGALAVSSGKKTGRCPNVTELQNSADVTELHNRVFSGFLLPSWACFFYNSVYIMTYIYIYLCGIHNNY